MVRAYTLFPDMNTSIMNKDSLAYALELMKFLQLTLLLGHTGFTVANVGCCGVGGNYKGVVPCLPNFNICPNRFDYLFWDPYHPTDKANVIIADRFWSSTEYSYPMNIQQLLMS